MSKVQMLRAFVNQRLTAAAEDIFGLFERTIAEYEEEIDRQRRLLQDRNTAVFPANVEKSTVIKEVPPERRQQRRSPGLDQEHQEDQEDPEDPPEPPRVKEEQEEVRTSQEGERLGGLFPFTPAPVKSEEDDEEKPQSSRLHSQPATRDMTSHSHEAEDGNDGLKQRREPQSGLNALENNHVPVSDAAGASFSCSECKDHLQIHMKCHAGEKTFTCPFCGKKFTKSSNLTTHLRVHTGEKPFTCSVCSTSFSLRCTLVNHMRVHTGEKPFSCSVCSKRFSKKANLTTHMALHTEEKPFKCSVCDKRFTWHSQVKNHKCVADDSGSRPAF